MGIDTRRIHWWWRTDPCAPGRAVILDVDVVKLGGNGMLIVGSGGRVVAGGNGAPVTFTSYRDPEVGGTVTAQPAPAPGDYMAAIELQASSSASITNAGIPL